MTKKNLCFQCSEEIKKYCCYQSVLCIGESGTVYNVVLKTKPCKYFDTETLKCLVYKNRFKVNPYCLPMKEAIRQNALQADCLYVKGKDNYKEAYPKITFVPDDLPKHVKLKLQAMEQMPDEEFRKMFLPLIL